MPGNGRSSYPSNSSSSIAFSIASEHGSSNVNGNQCTSSIRPGTLFFLLFPPKECWFYFLFSIYSAFSFIVFIFLYSFFSFISLGFGVFVRGEDAHHGVYIYSPRPNSRLSFVGSASKCFLHLTVSTLKTTASLGKKDSGSVCRQISVDKGRIVKNRKNLKIIEGRKIGKWHSAGISRNV